MEQSYEHVRIQGFILLPEEAEPFSGGTVRVRLEDVSLADAPAQTLLETVMFGVHFDGGGDSRLPFMLEGRIPAGRRRCSVRVLIDLDGDSDVSEGDYVSTVSSPPAGPGENTVIRVTRVR